MLRIAFRGFRTSFASVVTLALAVNACTSNTPAPTSPSLPAPTAAAPATEVWTVQVTPAESTGSVPEKCAYTLEPGRPYTTLVWITRSATVVDFKPGDPRYWQPGDWLEYSGTPDGLKFTVQNISISDTAQSLPCAPQQPWSTADTINGTFSEDGHHFVAQQVVEERIGDLKGARTYTWSGELP